MTFTFSGEFVMFFIFALFIIGGSIFMLSFTKVVHMAVALAFAFLSLGGLYVMLEAEFIAFVQILIYAGAVTILMIFGIMMTKHQNEDEEPKRPWHNGLLLVGSLGLFGILFYAIQQSSFTGNELAVPDNTRAIGELLFTKYVIPFETVSVLLTVAFVGAIIIAKREEE